MKDKQTRRKYLATTGSVLGGGMLAGCTSGDSQSADTPTTQEQTTASSTTGAEQSPGTTTQTDGPYSVTMSPVGTLEFESVPEDIYTGFPQFADMAVALGHGEKLTEVYTPSLTGDTLGAYLDHLDVAAPDWGSLGNTLQDGFNEETIYQADRDVHLIDPAYVTTLQGWDQASIDEIKNNVSPWFGNYYSGNHSTPPDAYRVGYEYLSLDELFEKTAQVFREQQRYQALTELRNEVLGTVSEQLPPESERPTVTRVAFIGGTFYAFHLNRPGYWSADTRTLLATDVFADQEWGGVWGTFDYETMLEADPEKMLVMWGMSTAYSVDDVRDSLESHSVGQNLQAVENDEVYPSGMRFQGPIMNLFQIEMTAKQLYPDQFGEWPDFQPGQPYPEVPESERLFDRDRLRSIINGDI